MTSKVKKQLLRCHCHQMQFLVFDGANTCPINCLDKKGQKYVSCPICDCTCRFVWRIVDHCAIVAESKLDSDKKPSHIQRCDESNRWFNESVMAGHHAAEYARTSLIENRKKGEIYSSDRQIQTYMN